MMSAKIDNNLIRCYEGSKISDKEIAAVWGDGAESQPSQPTAQPRGWENALDKNAMAEPTEAQKPRAESVQSIKDNKAKGKRWQITLEIAWEDTAKLIDDCQGDLFRQREIANSELLTIEYLQETAWLDYGLLRRLRDRFIGLIAAEPTLAKAAAHYADVVEGFEDTMAMLDTKAFTEDKANKKVDLWFQAIGWARRLFTADLWLEYKNGATAQQVRNRITKVFQALGAELGHNVRGIAVNDLRPAKKEQDGGIAPNMQIIANVEERPKEDDKLKSRLLEGIARGEVTYSDILELRYCTETALDKWENSFKRAAARQAERMANRLNRAFNQGTIRRITLLIIADPRAGADTSEIGKSYFMKQVTNALCAGSIKLHKGAADSDTLDNYEGQAVLQIDEHTGCNMAADTAKKLLDPENAIPMRSKYYNKANLALVNFVVSSQPLDAVEGLEGYRANVAKCFSGQAVWQFWRRITYVIRINLAEDGQRYYSVDTPSKGGIFGVSFEPTELQDVTLDTLLRSRIVRECRAVLNKAANY